MSENTGADESSGSTVSILDQNVEAAFERLREDLHKKQVMPEGTVVRFDLVTPAGQAFHYAGIFAAGQWWLTGVAEHAAFKRQMGHEDFINALSANGHRVANLGVATGFKTLEL